MVKEILLLTLVTILSIALSVITMYLILSLIKDKKLRQIHKENKWVIVVSTFSEMGHVVGCNFLQSLLIGICAGGIYMLGKHLLFEKNENNNRPKFKF